MRNQRYAPPTNQGQVYFLAAVSCFASLPCTPFAGAACCSSPGATNMTWAQEARSSPLLLVMRIITSSKLPTCMFVGWGREVDELWRQGRRGQYATAPMALITRQGHTSIANNMCASSPPHHLIARNASGVKVSASAFCNMLPSTTTQLNAILPPHLNFGHGCLLHSIRLGLGCLRLLPCL